MHIQELEIHTANLTEQTSFYSQLLGLPVTEKTGRSVSIQIGHSILKLTENAAFTPYHFAINIPSNQENEALHWLKQRVEVLTHEGAEIQYFDAWNAYAIYFYDADGNIVEFIARKTLDNQSDQPFDHHSLLEISEIGIPTTDIEKEFTVLRETAALSIYSGSMESFCAVGDEHGLFILVNKLIRKKWFPTDDPPISSDFKIRFKQRDKVCHFQYGNEILTFVPTE